MLKVELVLSMVLVLVGAAVFAPPCEGALPAEDGTLAQRSAADPLPELKVGFSQMDITPPAGGVMTGGSHASIEQTEDPIRAKALVV